MGWFWFGINQLVTHSKRPLIDFMLFDILFKLKSTIFLIFSALKHDYIRISSKKQQIYQKMKENSWIRVKYLLS